MADNSFRSYRGGDPYARSAAAPTAPAREPAHDPLAELARLIGQNDPFADPSRDSRPAPAESQYGNGQSAQSDWASDGYAEPDRYGAQPHADPHLAPQYHDEQPGERPYPGTAPRLDDRRYADGHDEPRDDHVDRGALQTRHSAPFVPAPPSGHGYEDEHEHDDRQDHHDEHDEHDEHDAAANRYPPDEFYDDAPNRRRRGGLVVVMAVLGLAVLGTAGAFAYRAMFGGAMLPSLPPIIKASGTPSKVVPSAQSADSGKAVDRVASAGQSEQVVSREEQPVELKDTTRSLAPRVISTIPVAPTSAATAAPVVPSPALASAPPTASAPATSDAQPTTAAPKKIRTVTIRPDQAGGTPGSAAAFPSPPSRSVASRSVAPHVTTAPPAPVPAQTVAPTGNEPLALVPTAGQSEPALSPPSNGRVRTKLARASAPPAAEHAEAAPSATGGYAVQVSSQHSEAEAHSAFKSLQSKFPNQLGGHAVIVRRADLGSKGVYYRAMVGPYASMEEAAGMCSSLKAAGGNCLIQKN